MYQSIPIFIDWILRVSIAVDVTILGTNWDNRDLSKDDDDSSENVDKKMNLSSFKLNSV